MIPYVKTLKILGIDKTHTCPLAVVRFGGNLAAANWFAASAPPNGDENWEKFILGYCSERKKVNRDREK